jgi:2-aminoadipate transaminase
MADPGYVGAIQAFRLAGARLLGIPSDREGMQVDVLSDRLRTGHRPALVYVVADHDNPSGATLTAERRRELAHLAGRYGFLVVDDVAYRELRFTDEPPPPLATLSDQVITVGTVSKILCPGLRVGYVVGPASVTAAVVMVKQAVDLHTSTIAPRTIHRVLTSPGFLDHHLRRVRRLYRDRATVLSASLALAFGDAISFARPEGGLFLWARFQSPGVDTQQLLATALDHGVAYVPGRAFGISASHDDALRLSFAAASPTDLAEAARRLQTAWESFASQGRGGPGDGRGRVPGQPG